MGQRRPQNRYIPMNFNSDLLQRRGRGRDRLINVRNMLPMTIRCNTCSNYHYIGTKFTMRMQICNDEMYLGIKVFRFYYRCTHCCNQITFKTDPKNAEYVVETGGVRNYDPKRDIKEAEKILKKIKTEEEEGDTMKTLENKTYDSKREMELMEVLEEIRNANKRNVTMNSEDLLKKFYENQILEVAQTEQDEQAMNREYQEKVAEFSRRQQEKERIKLTAAQIFNQNVRIQKERKEREQLQMQSGKRKLKPMIKAVVKKRQVEDEKGEVKVVEGKTENEQEDKGSSQKCEFKIPKSVVVQSQVHTQQPTPSVQIIPQTNSTPN